MLKILQDVIFLTIFKNLNLEVRSGAATRSNRIFDLSLTGRRSTRLFFAETGFYDTQKAIQFEKRSKMRRNLECKFARRVPRAVNQVDGLPPVPIEERRHVHDSESFCVYPYTKLRE